ncbi:hypothetical protein LINGRAPRIM_LOCUS1553 [Linum grandiflorum]
MIAGPYTVSQSPFHQASRFLESPIKCVIKASAPGSAPISSVFNRYSEETEMIHRIGNSIGSIWDKNSRS